VTRERRVNPVQLYGDPALSGLPCFACHSTLPGCSTCVAARPCWLLHLSARPCLAASARVAAPRRVQYRPPLARRVDARQRSAGTSGRSSCRVPA
jgi:hypothetical protein